MKEVTLQDGDWLQEFRAKLEFELRFFFPVVVQHFNYYTLFLSVEFDDCCVSMLRLGVLCLYWENTQGMVPMYYSELAAQCWEHSA